MFGSHSFEVYIFNPFFFKKKLSLIILVGWEFDIIIFLDLPFIL
jgi:hypothetical protein